MILMKNIDFLLGDYKNLEKCDKIHPYIPFDDKIIEFFNSLSKELMNNTKAKKYSDVITFAFFIRKNNVLKLKERYNAQTCMKLGLGNAFHIAPSNVPVNFAYSLFASLICGNANTVKVSNKEFEQVNIICDSIKTVLIEYDDIKPYINIIRYNNEKDINDMLSSICDIRIIWGGNDTINTIRQSKIKERTREITFSDRYSLAVIDIDYYNILDDKYKSSVMSNFYNDTYLSDQNACTSPRLLCFVGASAVDDFYSRLYDLVKDKYDFKDIFASNKYVSVTTFITSLKNYNAKLLRVNNSNLIYRVLIDNDLLLDEKLIDYKGNCGTFLEVHYRNMSDLLKLEKLCNDNSIQTISYLGDSNMFNDLLSLKLKGIDRVVPIGKTMDFDLLWDGYNLFEMFTRNISVM